MIPVEFVKKYTIAVIGAVTGTSLFASVKMAQLALETGWGKSVKGNNMTGIKADSKWKGKVISFSTREVIGGVSQYFTGTNQVYSSRAAVPANVSAQTLFRYYDSTTDSIKDHSKFLEQNARYEKAGVFSATTPEDQARALQAAGYATDPNYAASLISIINKYNLKELDQKKK
jgi:flagellum-specific peptidoglycan hydrolase FlgJ